MGTDQDNFFLPFETTPFFKGEMGFGYDFRLDNFQDG
jgi:hypothetical protein